MTITKDNPLVAILLCTYNGELFLAKQLDSLESQTHENWFLVASDDGSNDSTLEILRQYQEKWPKGKLFIRNGPQKGFCQNFLSLASDPGIKANYYAFCDQDDVWLPQKIAAGIALIEIYADIDNSVPILYGGKTIYVDENLKFISSSSSFNFPMVFRNALVQTMAGGNTMLFNNASKAIVEKTRWAKPASHDWWLYLLISGVEGICIFDQNPQVLYRQHKNSVVGGNQKFLAKLNRLYFLLGGRFKFLINENIKALINHQKLLSKNSRELLVAFESMRQANFLLRIRLFTICGLFRQTRNGTIALIIAVIFKQL
jgi:glycosyltransferase involved in cell wall biosynthesis